MRIKSIFVVAVLATAIFGFGGATDVQAAVNCMAYGSVNEQISCLQQVIAELVQQIATLQAQQGTTQTWCHTFSTNLGFANSGSSDVGALHTVLDKEGFSYIPDTGNIYDEGTAHAVIQLQAKYGILQTGYLGPLTRAKLNALYGCTTTPPIACLSGSGPLLPGQSYCNPTQPVVGISAPNTGEQWQMGSTYTIRWFADKFSTTDKVNIVLIDQRAGDSYYVIARDISAYANSSLGAGTPMGSYSWIIPTTGFIPGSTNTFKIYVGKYSPAFQNGDWVPLKSTADTGVYGYGNNFSIVSVSAAPIINDIRPSSILQGQTFQVTLYGYNLGGASNANGSCGLNPDALGGFVLGNCNIQPLFVSVSITATNNAIIGDRQFTITTPSGISNPVKFTVLSSSTNRNITVISPNGGEAWKFGETRRITWTSQGIDKVSIAVYNDTIYGSGSTNYLDPAGTSLSVPAAQGYFDWNILQSWTPKPAAGNEGRYKIRISDVNSQATRVSASSNYFTIAAPTTQPSITVTSPNGGESLVGGGTYQIRWTSLNLSSSENVNISFISLGGTKVLIATVPNSGLYNWTPPYGNGSPGIKIYISSATNSFVFDTSDGTFDVAGSSQPSITVTSPNGGETWAIGKAGATYPIIWSSSGFNSGATVSIFLLNATTNAHIYTIASGISNTGSYTWGTYNTPGSYKIEVLVGDNNGSASDNSNTAFTITDVGVVQPSITVTSPNGGEVWNVGETHTITWQSTGLPTGATVTISLINPDISDSNIRKSYPIITVAASSGTYVWTVPNITGSQAKISIFSGTAAADLSDNYFIIAAPTIACTNFTYSAWSACSLGGTQARTVATSSPSGCIGGNPIRSQSCTYVAPVSPTIKVTMPNDVNLSIGAAKAEWVLGSSNTIWWTSAGTLANVKIALYKGGSFLQNIVAQTPGTISGQSIYYTWSIPNTLAIGTDYKIKISKSDDATIYDDSDYFSIIAVAPSLTITSSISGETWARGSTHNITWTSTGFSTMRIAYGRTSSFSLSYLTTSQPASSGSYSWIIPSTLTTGSDYYLSFEGYNGSGTSVVTVVNKQTGTFSIVAPSAGLNTQQNNLASLLNAFKKLIFGR